MKQHMMIIGAKIVKSSTEPGKRDGIVELTCVPLTVVKEKTPGLLSIATGGLEELMKQTQNMRQFETKVCISISQWIEQDLKIARHVTVELLPDDTTGGVK